ncbi:MAG TPA: ABC transporter permease [Ignavibacteria bacterium]|nr:ABC transporter permease [Ignavibacteria bacterium]
MIRIKIFFENIWELILFIKRFFIETVKRPIDINETLRQSYLLGFKSLPLVSITGFVLGLVLALQLKPTLAKFGAEAMIPPLLSISIFREIGPVIIGLICAGKMSSAIGAELGSMKVTEQIDAMEVSAARPFRYLAVTRIWATTLTLPILVIYADTLSLAGGYIAMSLDNAISIKMFLNSSLNPLEFSDVFPSLLKTFVFGYSIGIVGCFKGYNCSRGTESVGRAANEAVVFSSLLIIIIDLIAVKITTFFY